MLILAPAALLLAAVAGCGAGGSSASVVQQTDIEYGLAGGDWDYTAEIPEASLGRLASAVADWNFISLPLHSQFSGNYRLHETQFSDGEALRLGMPPEAAGVKAVPRTWAEVKQTAAVTAGSLGTQPGTVELEFAFAPDAGELLAAAGAGRLAGVSATAVFSRPDAERLIRYQKEAWNGWYTGELARRQDVQLATEVSAEKLSVEWTLTGSLDSEPFSVRFTQLTSVISDIAE